MQAPHSATEKDIVRKHRAYPNFDISIEAMGRRGRHGGGALEEPARSSTCALRNKTKCVRRFGSVPPIEVRGCPSWPTSGDGHYG